jgi:glycosyltransferase involved in cell wall biosynthesis
VKRNKIRKILHLHNTSSIGGAEQVILDLAAFTDQKKFESYVGVFREGELVSEMRRRGIKFFWLKGNTRVYDYKFLKSIIQIIKNNRIDLVHSHTWGTDFYGYWASKILGVPMISTIHNRYYIFEKWDRRISYRVLISQIEKIVAVSADIQRLLRGDLKLKPGKISLIYNGIDTQRYESGFDLHSIRKELSLSEGELFIGNVGNLREVKDHHTLILAFHQVSSFFPQSKLLIVGDGELKSDLHKLSAQLGLEKKILILGHRQDVALLLSLLDIFVLSSRSEGCSISLLEAMASGKPVIATRVGGNPELVMEGKTGLLVPSAEPEKLAETIIQLLKDEKLREKRGEEGRKRVREKFSRESMVKNYGELYSQILR